MGETSKRLRLKTLAPRLVAIKPRIAEVSGTGWRSGKTTNERGYTYAWQKARERFLSENPLCKYCEKQGQVTAAYIVDHIVPHEGDETRFWDESNWQPLCKPCHDTVKAQEERARGRRG